MKNNELKKLKFNEMKFFIIFKMYLVLRSIIKWNKFSKF
jgi:hypothetical protein